jgi:GNAT superfamily N-acetyltransferase
MIKNDVRLGDYHVSVREFDINIDSSIELTVLLHKAYKRLADLGLHFWATTQTSDQTLDRIKGGICYIALIEERIVGTICFYPQTKKDNCIWYGKDDVGRFGQFAVDPDYQKIGLGRLLLDLVERNALASGKKHLAMDTSEKAHHLIAYYNRLGFQHVEYTQWERVNYQSTVMTKPLTEL